MISYVHLLIIPYRHIIITFKIDFSWKNFSIMNFGQSIDLEHLDQMLVFSSLVSSRKNHQRDLHCSIVDNQKGFTNALFSGHENSLFIWNMATFLFVDYFAFNYVLAAIITYLLNLVRVKEMLAKNLMFIYFV